MFGTVISCELDDQLETLCISVSTLLSLLPCSTLETLYLVYHA